MRGLTESVWLEASLVISILANVLNLIAFIGNGWAVPQDPDLYPQYEGIGLWKQCKKDSLQSDSVVYCVPLQGNYDLPGWFTTVQALITTSLIGFFIALMTGVSYTCIKKCQRQRCLILVYLLLTITFACIGAGGVILFGKEIETVSLDEVKLKISWSYITAVVVVAVHFICVLLSAVELCIGPRPMSGADTEAVICNAAAIANSQPPAMESRA